jgi:hypothetical protein
MYRTPLILLLCLAPAVLTAAESGESNTGLYTIIGGVLAAVIGWLVARFGLKTKSDPTPIDPKMPVNEAKNFFIDRRLIPFVISTGQQWLTTRVPALLGDALDGDGFDWANHWQDLHTYVKNRVTGKFRAENQDVLEYLGTSQELDDLINRQLTKLLTKLPDEVQGLLPESLVHTLTRKARQFLTEKGQELLAD